MNDADRKFVTGYLWAVLAILTCPCHLPLLAVVLAGTTAGAVLSQHWVIAALGLISVFGLSLVRAMRTLGSRAAADSGS